MKKKSKTAKSSWWIFAIVGIIFHLSILDYSDFWVVVLIGALNGAFWGWLLGLLLDYIINKLFYQETIEEIDKPTTKEKPKTVVSKTTNHDDYKPKATEYTAIIKENTARAVAEPVTPYEVEKKSKPKTEPEQKPKIEQTKKTKKKEILPTSIKEKPKDVSDIKYVNYNLKFSESEKNFPILKIPNQKCVVRSYRLGSTKRRGFKETSFQNAIEYFFSDDFEILGNTRLNTGKNTRPFEPDIAMIGSSSHNIRIDIEIDEPYAGITRQPTHCIGDDINRDNYFKDRGWIVVRFSEFQVHTQEKECLKFIAGLISHINSSFNFPNELKTINKIEKEKVWDVVQAQKWEKSKYREQYLNHEFKTLEEEQETLRRDFDEQEIEEEKLVVSTSFGKEDGGKNIGFNNLNKHIKDSRIKFYSEKHIYTIDGVPAPSASTIIGRFFPEFDTHYWSNRKAESLGMTPKEVADMWEQKGKKARDKGTFLHEQIENYYLGIEYIETEEFDQFKDFLNDHNDLEPYRSEWRIFDDSLNIAGTIDLIASNGTNHDIYDWKRSKKVVNTFNGQPIEQNQWQQGVGGLAHIDDTSYNRYCLQQSLYKYILEKNYDIKIDNMYLIVMYPENDNYYKVKVPYLENEIEYILKTV